MLDIDVVFQQDFTNGAACSRLQFCPSWAEFSMGHYFDDWH
jgi:hypothetical protein